MLFLCVLASSLVISSHEEKSFVAWMRSTKQLYVGDEYNFRLGVFLTNSRAVQKFNSKSSFRVALNQFATLTTAEYKSLLGHRSVPTIGAKKNELTASKKHGDAIDWRDTPGIVGAIKDQGQCGSCWAFSVIFAQEAQWALHNSQTLVLAEQNLVDCVTYCYGCDGGDEYISYQYVIESQAGHFELEKDYPYTARDGACKWDSSKAITTVLSFVRQQDGNEENLADNVESNGPLSIAIDASNWSFQLYDGGIYDEPDCDSQWLDHAVGLVGFGSENGVPYWIVRNSWNVDWGEDGYIRMIRNKKNQCGVATDVVLPIEASA